MSKRISIEHQFIEKLIADRVELAVFLKHGIKLKGVLVGQDETVIWLDGVVKQAIYKSSISTIVPQY
ncbi:MAG: RNA chaperone Hfq [Gammaproteobacteria bacterium]|nr:RNA chaperone Hfq [Gammaproteobacteria bacterium]